MIGRMTIVHMDLSIVIPTFNEKNNVRLITMRIMTILNRENCQYEILFVDDSLDDTPTMLKQLCQQFSCVRYIHRENESGLASAVVKGFCHSQGTQIIVMDGDLQHPPELIPLILKRLVQADIVIPSRFVPGGSDGGLNIVRKLISGIARGIGCISLKKLRPISDSTSGYFALKRSVIDRAHLDPIGWKILIEILIKGHYRTIHEIPYTFVAREAGESKMSIKEQYNYIRHIARLVSHSPEDRKLYSFCIIGALGVFVNLFCLHLFLKLFEMGQLSASINASCIAMIHNFLWNNNVTWRECKQQVLWRRIIQFSQFSLFCGLGIAITTLFAQIFLSLGWNIYVGQLLGISASISWNFFANSKWTWPAVYNETNIEELKPIVTQEIPSKISWN